MASELIDRRNPRINLCSPVSSVVVDISTWLKGGLQLRCRHPTRTDPEMKGDENHVCRGRGRAVVAGHRYGVTKVRRGSGAALPEAWFVPIRLELVCPVRPWTPGRQRRYRRIRCAGLARSTHADSVSAFDGRGHVVPRSTSPRASAGSPRPSTCSRPLIIESGYAA